ncbi:hypothetical protein TSTA_113250 [Talaromyces stipitatus ATCC 10500]|uniref:ABC transmembrane type-1 domain-containing protein n=1 Tax=Talaromyces stipitatus (strain ATCC 10500 / CBS 375.48 / QM 6759 / NRRL 1006) TaxID=441959 RepID=B8MCX3_TALSN|nr:uncharacterized protein TSTA_113250 [Talaromyces stipitatus ATCC 10500]EED17499.1 hypothetical protein TSTA_113250 [Talaromyces stipitatus ATCC 10500]
MNTNALLLDVFHQRWLNLILDLVVTAIAVTIVALASQIHGLSSDGALGVALSNVVSFSRILMYLIQAWTQMETSMVIVPNGDWSTQGAIRFKNLTSGYGQEADIKSETKVTDFDSSAQSSPILKDITLNIEPDSKVGDHSNEEILSALAEGRIFGLIESRGGLSPTLNESSLLSGQQQLICPARALINRSRTLILGEATSNIDKETETKMMKADSRPISRMHYPCGGTSTTENSRFRFCISVG